MHSPTLIKTFTAEGDINRDRFVALAENGNVSQASSSESYILGVTGRLGAANQDKIDVILQGLVEVEAGENITAPAAITVNQQGQAITATSGTQVAGLAITSANAGEVVSVLLGYYSPLQFIIEDNTENEEQNDDQQNNEPQAIAVTNEIVTYNTEASAFVLAHSPVVADSLVVKSADGETTYTADTDYTVTLADGKISSVVGTSMTFAENATIKVSYQYTESD